MNLTPLAIVELDTLCTSFVKPLSRKENISQNVGTLAAREVRIQNSAKISHLIASVLENSTTKNIKMRFELLHARWSKLKSELESNLDEASDVPPTLAESARAVMRTINDLRPLKRLSREIKKILINDGAAQAYEFIKKITNHATQCKYTEKLPVLILTNLGKAALLEFMEALEPKIRTTLFFSVAEEFAKSDDKPSAKFLIEFAARFLKDAKDAAHPLYEIATILYEDEYARDAIQLAYFIPNEEMMMCYFQETFDDIIFIESGENDNEFAKRVQKVIKELFSLFEALPQNQTKSPAAIISETIKALITDKARITDRIDPISVMLCAQCIPCPEIRHAVEKLICKKPIINPGELDDLRARALALDPKFAQYCTQLLPPVSPPSYPPCSSRGRKTKELRTTKLSDSSARLLNQL